MSTSDQVQKLQLSHTNQQDTCSFTKGHFVNNNETVLNAMHRVRQEMSNRLSLTLMRENAWAIFASSDPVGVVIQFTELNWCLNYYYYVWSSSSLPQQAGQKTWSLRLGKQMHFQHV